MSCFKTKPEFLQNTNVFLENILVEKISLLYRISNI